MNLAQLGWSDFFAASFQPHAEAGRVAARVAVQRRGRYEVWSAGGIQDAGVSGRFRHRAGGPAGFPAVGDWVALESPPGDGKAIIHAVLPRRTKLSRTAAGVATDEQVLAANMDEVLIVAALAEALNLRRLERYLTLAWESGARPVLVLTKADLCEDVVGAVQRAHAIAGGAPVLAMSGVTGEGVERLHPLLGEGRTLVLLGPSGAGKSTLINHLCGEAVQEVQLVRANDNKGRHTTIQRELIALPSGAWVIDTPGLRELQLWSGEAGLGEAFADVEHLAAGCRFRDCRHEAEPGCAVREAVDSGSLEAARLESHGKLRRELAHFERRHDARAKAELRRKWRAVARHLRAQKKPGG